MGKDLESLRNCASRFVVELPATEDKPKEPRVVEVYFENGDHKQARVLLDEETV